MSSCCSSANLFIIISFQIDYYSVLVLNAIAEVGSNQFSTFLYFSRVNLRERSSKFQKVHLESSEIVDKLKDHPIILPHDRAALHCNFIEKNSLSLEVLNCL